MTSAKYFDAISLVVTRGHSGSTRGHSWSLVVTRGHSWSFVVTRGHSCVFFRHDRPKHVYICNFPTVKLFLVHVFILSLNLKPNKFRLLCLRTVRKCSNSARFYKTCSLSSRSNRSLLECFVTYLLLLLLKFFGVISR